jgi:hypothetical protein
MDVRLPPGYRLQRDPDVLVLRRSDGCFVAAFSVLGASREDIEEAAREDRREVGARVRGSGRDEGAIAYMFAPPQRG